MHDRNNNSDSLVSAVPRSKRARLWARLRFGLPDESGQALLLVAGSLAALLGFAGLVIDVGQLRYAQSQLQSAADAAAIAGALEISYCGGTTNCSVMQTAVQQAVVENGLTGSTLLTQCASNSNTGLIITLNNGPCSMSSDPNAENPNYVEVLLTQTAPTFFEQALGINSVKIGARAEATIGNSQFCVDILDPGGLTFEDTGTVILNAPTCGILDDSSSSDAFSAAGSATVTASAIDIHGGDRVSGNVQFPSAKPVLNAPKLLDPLNWLNSQTPNTAPCTFTSTVNVTSNQTLNPGVYCGGISISGSSTVAFNPGTYVITGSTGLSISGSGTLTGTGVTFYFSNGSLSMSGSTTMDIIAPTTGTYAGVLLFQSPTDASPMTMSGSSSSKYQGAIYLPDAALTISGGGNSAAYTILDVYSLDMSGSVDFSLGSDYSSLPGGSPAKGTAVLAE
jgi:Flp pilus assembly protein TadG